VIGAFALSALSLSAVGVLLGGVLPTARAAQGAGLLLLFVMFMLGGGGPPREVMTDSMRLAGDFLPLTHVVTLLQDPWNGFGWNAGELGIVAGVMVAAGLLATRVFRWE
jgi:ABC-2 type transport system permease protein